MKAWHSFANFIFSVVGQGRNSFLLFRKEETSFNFKEESAKVALYKAAPLEPLRRLEDKPQNNIFWCSCFQHVSRFLYCPQYLQSFLPVCQSARQRSRARFFRRKAARGKSEAVYCPGFHRAAALGVFSLWKLLKNISLFHAEKRNGC